MDFVRDRVAFNLRVLRNQLPFLAIVSPPMSDFCSSMHVHIETILWELRYLTLIKGCIHKWIEAEAVVLHSAIKIEACVQEMASQVEGKVFQRFKKEVVDIAEDRPPIFFSWPKFQKRASKILDVLACLNEKINLLKGETREAFKNLLGQQFLDHPFRCRSPMADFTGWKEFVSSVDSFLIEFKDKFANDDERWNKVDDFRHCLETLQKFLDGLPDIPSAQDFSIQVANIAIRAALVSFQWWANKFDPNMKEEVLIALLDLPNSTRFTDPELLDQMLRLLKTLEAKNCSIWDKKAVQFVRHVLPFNRRFEKITGKCFEAEEKFLPFILTKELESLTISILPYIPDKDAEDEQCFLQDFNLLILEIEQSFSCSLSENGSLLLNLLAKVLLMKFEVFIIQQITAGPYLLLSEKGQIDALNQGLQQIEELQVEHCGNVNQILSLMKVAVKLATTLHLSFDAKDIEAELVRIMLFLLHLNVLHLKIGRKLYDNNGSSTLVVKDRVQSYLEELKFLINCLMNQHGDLLKDGLLTVAQVEAMARSVTSLYRTLLTQNTTKELFERDINLKLSQLQHEIKSIMEMLARNYLHFPCSNFPKTNALGFFDALLTKLRELLLNYQANFFLSVKQYIEEILADLEFFRCCLGDILEFAGEGNPELGNLAGNLINVTYEAEYLLDSIVAGESESQNLIWLYHLLQNLRHIKIQVTKFNERKTCDVKVHNVPHISRHVVSETSTPNTDDLVLGLSDQQELIINQLLRKYPPRDIVLLVGRSGIGKTTLAKKVYGSPMVAKEFHIRAWCCVTEAYRKRELLFQILSHIIVITDNIRGMSDEDLDFKLRQLLLKKKYLIVMDDMGNNKAWDDLQASFPDDENGSRILITSRLNLEALKVKAYSNAHNLRQLSDAESWKLLQMRIFGEEACPKEFIKVGREIAKICKGLPLAIVAMAGLLQRIDRQQSLWEDIVKNLSSRIVNDPEEQCHDILELSYKLLPGYLKACFLYFGAFLEDEEIPVKKLIRLWIAEGFVRKPETESKSLEDLAEDYLNDLIGRSLVVIAQQRFGKGTKACRVHDVLRSLCQSKAQEDKFLQVIARSNESNTPDYLDFLPHINFINPSKDEKYEDSRLFFYSTRNHFVQARPSGPFVRSLLFFSTRETYARSSYDISFICDNFRLLKVLDLECINMGPSFPSGIEFMVWLRYLAVSGDVVSVPSSITKLSNLETLVVKGLKGKVILPDTIWCLKRLRHVQVSDVAVITVKHEELGNSTLLENLVTLSSPYLPCGENTSNVLRKIPNLRKLACIFSESRDCAGSYSLFPRLDVLTQLESLKITYYGRPLRTAEFVFPLSLKKLTLSNFRLPWSEIWMIGRLQNLEVLKLLSRSYEGETWDMEDEEFCNLKFLKLDSLNIAKWSVSNDNLPKLEHLVLRNCKNLEEVPSSFGEISTLQKIEVQWCGKYAEESARRMQEGADEYLKIIITSDLDSCAAL